MKTKCLQNRSYFQTLRPMLNGERKFRIAFDGLQSKRPRQDLCAEHQITEAEYIELERRLVQWGSRLYEDASSGGQQEELELHQAAMAATRYEGQLLWQIFGAFLIIHTVNAGFILQAMTTPDSPARNLRMLLGGFIGAALTVIWIATYLRNSAHYRFFLARARETEPKGWNLYANEGRAFSMGESVRVGNGRYQLPWPANWVRSGRMVPPVICCFFLIYAVTIICSVIALNKEDFKPFKTEAVQSQAQQH